MTGWLGFLCTVDNSKKLRKLLIGLSNLWIICNQKRGNCWRRIRYSYINWCWPRERERERSFYSLAEQDPEGDKMTNSTRFPTWVYNILSSKRELCVRNPIHDQSIAIKSSVRRAFFSCSLFERPRMAGSVVHTLGVALYCLRRVDFTYCLYGPLFQIVGSHSIVC